MDKNKNQNKVAYFAAGCFWSVEEAFRTTLGVVKTAVGYMGGSTEGPTYEQVCTDKTGHAEVVQVTYDPQQTTYDKLLDKFWEVHDPTQMNRQGPDVGTQYRTVIFYETDEQKQLAEASKKKLQESGKYSTQTIATTLEPASTFNRAEDYHQQYLLKKGKNVCH